MHEWTRCDEGPLGNGTARGEPGDLVVMNPTDELEEGMTVKTHEAAGAK